MRCGFFSTVLPARSVKLHAVARDHRHLLVVEERRRRACAGGSRGCPRRRTTRPRRGQRRAAARCAPRRSSPGRPPTAARSRTARAAAAAPAAPRARGRRRCISCSTRCATTSVSVSVTNLWPFALQLLLELQVVLDDAVVDDDDRPVQSRCGWAFSSVGRPCVAQRVWPRP